MNQLDSSVADPPLASRCAACIESVVYLVAFFVVLGEVGRPGQFLFAAAGLSLWIGHSWLLQGSLTQRARGMQLVSADGGRVRVREVIVRAALLQVGGLLFALLWLGGIGPGRPLHEVGSGALLVPGPTVGRARAMKALLLGV